MYFNLKINESYKLLLSLFILSTCNINSMSLGGTLVVPKRLGEIAVQYKDNEFFVKNKSELKIIPRCNIDKNLRGIPREKLVKLLIAGGYLQLNKYENCDEYNLKFNGRLQGGGIGGFNVGWYSGKLIVSGIGHGTLLFLSTFAGPGQPAAFIALESTFGPLIESASTIGGLAGGIMIGSSTGPV